MEVSSKLNAPRFTHIKTAGSQWVGG